MRDSAVRKQLFAAEARRSLTSPALEDRSGTGLSERERYDEPRACSRSSAARRALTLLEVIIAIVLIVVLLSAALTFLWQTLEIRKDARMAADRTQIARQVLNKIESELRGCVGSDQIGFPVEQRLAGDRRSINFLTTALPKDTDYVFRDETETPPPAAHDLRLVSYSLWVDQNNTDENGEPIVGGIIRSEKQTLNQYVVDETNPLAIRNDLWSHELAYLEFRYFDGVEWDTKWDITEGNSLPQLVMVTVGFKPITSEELDNSDLSTYPVDQYPFGPDEVKTDRYTAVVRLPAADKFFGSRIQRVGKQLTDQLGVGGVK